MKTRFDTRRLLGAFALASALAAPSLASAQSTCLKWDFSRPWVAVQGDYRVEFRLNEQRPDFEGTASYSAPGKGTNWVLFIPTHPFGSNVQGRVTGTVDGDSIEMQTSWGGVYTASVDHRGRLVGTTFDKANPAARSRANWVSDRTMNCLLRRAPPAGSNGFNADGRRDIL